MWQRVQVFKGLVRVYSGRSERSRRIEGRWKATTKEEKACDKGKTIRKGIRIKTLVQLMNSSRFKTHSQFLSLHLTIPSVALTC